MKRAGKPRESTRRSGKEDRREKAEEKMGNKLKEVDRDELGVRAKREEKVRAITCAKLNSCSRYKYPGLLFVLCLLCISRAKNFPSTTLARYTNTQPLPTATALFPVY